MLKKNHVVFIICIFLGFLAKGQNHKILSPKLSILEFYSCYANESDSGFNVHKLNLVLSKYCTTEFTRKAKKYLNNGFDLATADYGISKKALATLKIFETFDKTTFIVTYQIETYPVSPTEPVIKTVRLTIKLQDNGSSFRIEDVK